MTWWPCSEVLHQLSLLAFRKLLRRRLELLAGLGGAPTVASLSSLIGMPMVEVMLTVLRVEVAW